MDEAKKITLRFINDEWRAFVDDVELPEVQVHRRTEPPPPPVYDFTCAVCQRGARDYRRGTEARRTMASSRIVCSSCGHFGMRGTHSLKLSRGDRQIMGALGALTDEIKREAYRAARAR